MAEYSALVPTFAVVGRVNEGKSSIVSTLTEDDSVAIGADPGTTEQSQVYTVRGDGIELLRLIDTPGFEQAEEVMDWLTAQSPDVIGRRDAVQNFLDTFSAAGQYQAECRLLKPILAGAAIIYIVGSNHPFRAGYEREMEILRWTGQPRLAIINQGPGDDYTAQWRLALEQFFNIVRVFDAHRGPFEDRMELLSALEAIDERKAKALAKAKQVLQQIDRRRQKKSAEVIAQMLGDMLTFRMPVPAQELGEPDKQAVVEQYYAELRAKEAACRQKVEQLYRYRAINRVESSLPPPIYDLDLFGDETWQMLGQPKWKLLSISAAVGATIGGLVDVKTAGATGFLGAPIGALIAGASAFGAIYNEPESKVGKVQLAGKVATVGPHKGANFPWVVLDRALLHWNAIRRRTHAVRTPLDLADNPTKLAADMTRPQSVAMAKTFAKLRRSTQPPPKLVAQLADDMASLFVKS